MTKPIVISVAGEPQGVVVPNGGDFRFLAVKLGVFSLDGQVFETIEAARDAARAVVEGAAELAQSFEASDGSDEGLVA
ncbi:hypothetical protein [Pelagibacterium lacus]|uniref:Uncharacterized protein n=1 Tax=Pelagibacterium lacus TaxID=2282655 RepID=A0A369WB00_9HYPH|nr:hypothetical protein [Pelagibacterium lacus]RDE10570.1 hypothetical protein DVH29_01060 [Pelagibacterium lacus]